MKRVIIVGSPRSNGRSAHLAEMLFEANIDERPEDELYLVPVSEVEIGPCIGCNACRKQTPITFTDDNGEETCELRCRCIFDDDMQTLYDLLDEADELTVVSPVYFSGTPAPMKCILDRMQPYFWITQARGRDLAASAANRAESKVEPVVGELSPAYLKRLSMRRPATLHVVGEGGDPHGFAPLVGEVKSALACAGFRLEHVFDWVGKIDHAGEIVAEADELDLESQVLQTPATATTADTIDADAQPHRPSRNPDEQSRKRPKLNLSAGVDRDEQSSRSNANQKSRSNGGPSQGKHPSQGKSGKRSASQEQHAPHGKSGKRDAQNGKHSSHGKQNGNQGHRNAQRGKGGRRG